MICPELDTNGERSLVVTLRDRPLHLKLVSVQKTLPTLKIGLQATREEHQLYFASKLHRGGVQICRFLAQTTQVVDLVFEPHDVLHFKAFGDTNATMFLVGNYLEPVPRLTGGRRERSGASENSSARPSTPDVDKAISELQDDCERYPITGA